MSSEVKRSARKSGRMVPSKIRKLNLRISTEVLDSEEDNNLPSSSLLPLSSDKLLNRSRMNLKQSNTDT